MREDLGNDLKERPLLPINRGRPSPNYFTVKDFSHPSNHSLLLISLLGLWGAGEYPSYHRVRGGVHTGQVVSLSGLTQRDRKPLLTLTPMGNLDSPVNLTPLTAGLWTVGGSRSTRREPTQTWGEHANSPEKGRWLRLDGGVELSTFLLLGNSANCKNPITTSQDSPGLS